MKGGLTSDTMMSTSLTGSSISSIFPLIRVISAQGGNEGEEERRQERLALSQEHIDEGNPPHVGQLPELTIGKPVLLHNLLRLIQDITHIHPDDHLGPSLRTEHGQDSRPASYVEDDLVLEQVRVLEDGVSVREGSDGVFEHLFVDTCDMM